MNTSKSSLIAWLVTGVVTLAALFNVGIDLLNGSGQGNLLKLLGTATWDLFAVVFALVGALIVSRQPRNVIGWLLMLPATVPLLQAPIAAEIQSVTVLPSSPSLPLLLAVWFGGTDWVLGIFPLLFIALLFPTGRPPSRRWLWVAGYAFGVCAFFLFVATFAKTLELDSTTYNTHWSIANPIGFIPDEVIGAIFGPWWSLALGVATLLCVASLFVRYRGAPATVKEQIKWLLYACALFAAVYVPLLFTEGNLNGLVGDVLNLLFVFAILGIPISIGIAILRYRLYDIDLIIRRTLIYGALTALLALFYFGGVIVLQQLFRLVTGQSSELAIIVSTLAIAALFNPLRRSVQDAIDHRFYRRKYDAARVLARFAVTVRDEVELELLSDHLVEVVGETMQPRSVSLWLKQAGENRRQTPEGK